MNVELAIVRDADARRRRFKNLTRYTVAIRPKRGHRYHWPHQKVRALYARAVAKGQVTAADAWELDPDGEENTIRMRLAYCARKGYLIRVARGVYQAGETPW